MQYSVLDAVHFLQQGEVIIYPTEAVFGLGCDPENPDAIEKILAMKHRSRKKGMILIASDFSQLQAYIEDLPTHLLAPILKTWPGPFTWLFPAKPHVSEWIRGIHSTVAVRVTAHPIAKAICQAFGQPIISTSANREGQEPARNSKEVMAIFDASEYGGVVEGEVGDAAKPTQIRDALTQQIIRQ